MRLVVLIGAAVLAAVVGGSLALAQEEVTLEDVQAQFGDLTRAEIEALGYVVDPLCVTAELAGAPAELGGMGFHAVNAALIDETVDALEPEIILLDADDNVVGVEYETSTADIDQPVILGQEMPLLEGGHPGMEFDHYVMHAWFIDNPNGQFADFNPNLSCPAAPVVAPSTGTGGYLSGGDGSGLTLLPLLAAIAGAMLLAGGWALRRVASR